MQKKQYETIIIGGGISGLSCAKTLHEKRRDFLLLTENIGGRVQTSADGRVNYGAYYVGKDYLHALSFVRRGRRLKRNGVHFHHNEQAYRLASSKLFKHPLQTLRFLWILARFRTKYNWLKKSTLAQSQKQAIESDSQLHKLYLQPATEFIMENGLEDIAHDYLEELLHSTCFSSFDETTAFGLLQFSLPIIVPIYEFQFDQESILPFKSQIIMGSAVKIQHSKGIQTVTTKDGKRYHSQNLVIALPIHRTKKLIHLPNIKKPITAHMTHVSGVLKVCNKGQEELFGTTSNILAIARQQNETYIFYSKNCVKLQDYFEKYHIIAHKFWNPAFNTNGNVLIECKQGDGLYLIGDYNICGLEDSCITGIYAANQISKS